MKIKKVNADYIYKRPAFSDSKKGTVQEYDWCIYIYTSSGVNVEGRYLNIQNIFVLENKTFLTGRRHNPATLRVMRW